MGSIAKLGGLGLLIAAVAIASGGAASAQTGASPQAAGMSAYGPPIDTPPTYPQAAPPQPGDLTQVQPQEDAFAGQRPIAPPPWDRAVRFTLGMGSAMINTVLFPVKLVIGVAGAEVGGLAGALNGGDVEAAAGIWNVTTDGSYFDTPQIIDGRAPFRYGSDEN